MTDYQNFRRKPLGEVVNIPVTREIKTLLVALARSMGMYKHTELARSILVSGIIEKVKELNEDQRKLLDAISQNTVIADKIEEIMLNELRLTD